MMQEEERERWLYGIYYKYYIMKHSVTDGKYRHAYEHAQKGIQVAVPGG